MQINPIKPRKALNKAYLKVKPNRSEIERFKKNLTQLLDQINETESEEWHKNLVSDFLKNTYYKPDHYINTKGRTDLVIHNGKDAKSTVGVIIEAKKPTNKAEMLGEGNLNTKALHELILYFLRERITQKNLDIKYLAVTNIYEWYIFDANLFEKVFAQNKELVKRFQDFEEKRLSGTTTDYFYDEIAKPLVEKILSDEGKSGKYEYTYFDIREYEKALRNDNKADDTKLIALYKLLAPEHLLKLPFANDSNSLDKSFYAELLHIIGLVETKEGSKKLIGRKKEGSRNAGSLLESAIIQLDSMDKVSRLDNPSQFGETHDERLYSVALELVITWVNRILFLKLLEAQMISYHHGDKDYSFLNHKKVHNYDDLNSLFFSVLARKHSDRIDSVKDLFSHVPYLNSSLFEVSEIENKTIVISNLRDEIKLPISSGTVLKDSNGKKRTGELNALEYFFEFLNAYDFSSEGSEEIQEDNKALINASVLGLIFEKINGYKDGSFFTPGFITMYMCRESIRRAVVQKFNDIKGWECKTLDDLYNKIDDPKEANEIINSLKICDPAVGSGHFLVSALNEIIAIKSDLKILQDRNGRRLKEYHVEVVNDELIISDEDNEFFEYHPKNKESQRIQETLFHEKQTIIENCLFGVDINPNSVKICRLRLWIELLKNAYYKNETELETLPNIDINIKCGNSLISRFDLDADISKALKKSKWSIDMYRNAVQSYREAGSKEEKREMERLISDIKQDFETEIAKNDKRVIRLNKVRGELFNLTNQQSLFDMSSKEKKAWEKQVEKLTKSADKLEREIEEIKSNKIYENAFEWRFEFPEVLDEEGGFVGFDVVIGNPPYGVNFNKNSGKIYEQRFSTFNWRGESYILFIEKGISLLKNLGAFGYIVPDTLLNLGFTHKARLNVLKETKLKEVVLLPSNVFNDATVDTILIFFSKYKSHEDFNRSDILVKTFSKKRAIDTLDQPDRSFKIPSKVWFRLNSFNVRSNVNEILLIEKVDNLFPYLNDFSEIFYGIKVYQTGKGKPPQTKKILNNKPFTSSEREGENWMPFFDGKHIGYYSLLWKNDNWINYGPWLAEPRIPKKFEGEKILIRKITSETLIANYIPYTSYCNTLLFVLKLIPAKSNIPYKSLLGILNSRFIGWYFRKKFQISEDDTFPQIMIRDILQFSIPNFDNRLTKKIEELVDIIILNKEKALNTHRYENEIDVMVYKLYDLTYDEVKIVDPEIGMSEEEYSKFKI